MDTNAPLDLSKVPNPFDLTGKPPTTEAPGAAKPAAPKKTKAPKPLDNGGTVADPSPKPVKPKAPKKAAAPKKAPQKAKSPKKVAAPKKAKTAKPTKPATKKVAPAKKAKKAAKAKPAKSANGAVRTERLDMRLTPAEKKLLRGKSKALGKTVTEVVIDAIAKLK
jgi:hypothetical protein